MSTSSTPKRKRGEPDRFVLAAEEVSDLDLVRHMDDVMIITGEFANSKMLAILMNLTVFTQH